MALGTRRSRERRQRRLHLLLRFSQALAVILTFLGVGVIAYRGAEELARQEVTTLEAQVARLTQQEADMQRENTQLAAMLEQARRDMRQLEARYAQDVPRAPFTQFLTAARERLSAGVAAERLVDVIRTAENPRRCEGRAIMRRFAIRFGGTPNTEEGTSFAEGLLRVSVAMPAGAEDIARQSTVSVTTTWNGRTETREGLPQRLSLPLGNLELDLTISASELRGFAQAALASCQRG